MQKALETIQKHAKVLKGMENSDQRLFEVLNSKPKNDLTNLKDDFYSDIASLSHTRLQPVNLLRFDILNLLNEGRQINYETVEEIKDKIIEKDDRYFSKYGDTLVNALKNYPKKKKSPFINWQKNFCVFFPFIYTNSMKEETNDALKKINEDLKNELKLSNYSSHIVDFNGPQNYGTSWCWIAKFPRNKISHRKAYQLFLSIQADKIEAGILAGWDVNDKSSNNLEDFNTINEVVEKLKQSRETVDKKNNALINYWKFAPGENGIMWDEFYKEGIIAIGWDNLKDLNEYTTESLAEALEVEEADNSNQVWNIENFRDASIDDVVIANKGKSKALGIGVITSEYEFAPKRKEYKHIRRVEWLINHLVDFEKTIFRPDTFSPTLKWDRIKENYSQDNPAFEEIIKNLESGKQVLPPPKALPKDSETQNFWWLNANPKIWRIDSYELGDIQSYTSHNSKGNKRRLYKYFQEAKPGDLVIGYESTPIKHVKAIFEITERLHSDESEGEIINFEIKEIVKDPISWEELKETKGLENCEVFVNNQGLFKLQPDEFDIIRDLIDEKNIITEKEIQEIDIKEYDFNKDPDRPFFEGSEIQEIIQSLEIRKNIVLQGPPGVGNYRKFLLMERFSDKHIRFRGFLMKIFP